MSVFAYLGSFPFFVWALFIIGIVLIIIEMLQPGLGVPGILGGIAMIVAICLQAKTIVEAIIMLAVIATIVGLLFLLFARFVYKGRLAGKATVLVDQAKPVDIERKYEGIKLGDTGKVQTMLRPVGMALINGHKVEVVSQGEFIQPGTMVKVVEISGLRIVVEELGE